MIFWRLSWCLPNALQYTSSFPGMRNFSHNKQFVQQTIPGKVPLFLYRQKSEPLWGRSPLRKCLAWHQTSKCQVICTQDMSGTWASTSRILKHKCKAIKKKSTYAYKYVYIYICFYIVIAVWNINSKTPWGCCPFLKIYLASVQHH